MSFDVVGTSAENKALFEQLSQERKALQAAGDLPSWYTTQAWQMFKNSYLVPGEAAVRGRHERIAKTLARHLGKHAAVFEKKFFDELWNGILSPASPALSNTGTGYGQPVSCSGQVISDSVDSFYNSLHEMAILSKEGFGTSGDFSTIRHRGAKFGNGGKANGVSDVIDDFFTAASKISQNGKRRGSFGAYLDIEHADWDEVADKLTADSNGRNYGWVVRDSFIARLKAGEEDAMRRFTKALYIKLITGKGYYFFVDKANRHRPQMYVEHGLKIVATNLCTEIMLHSSDEYTYSCILASLNLVHWDRIKVSDSVFVATVFLDCLCSEFLETSKNIPGLAKVRAFTEKGRAIGLGVMGFHTYLQSQNIAYSSLEAQFVGQEIAQHLSEASLRASQWLAQEFGEPDWCKGHRVRNTHRIAYAPTKTTALLMGGVSESWFPDPGVIFEAASSVGELSRITPVFYELMKKRGVYNEGTLNQVIRDLGSVRNCSWMTDHEKQVFANAFEIDQKLIFRRAMMRQKWTCQGQSLNFWFAEEGAEDQIAELMTEVFLHEDALAQYYFYSRSGVVVTDECIACAA